MQKWNRKDAFDDSRFEFLKKKKWKNEEVN